ncbi:VOC family protein [Donghicola mangrovi]|uniref:VOC family protein n=1 Tax=Donghicola mangrovi TaxID=2729614 RepID=A0A850Q0D7_9RHOB|nr:VOC family protein [Donghicola mangrovi]NVO22464.1 VOC family protein [Donghicola mangrovi]
MKANRVTLVTLGVADLARARGYYEALGWEVETAQEGVCFFDLGGTKLGLYDKAALAEDLGRSPADLGTGAMTLAQNFATEADVDAAYDAALAAGATPCKAPEKVFWGGYSGTLADPDGHIWEYAMNPFWKLDEEGKLV